MRGLSLRAMLTGLFGLLSAVVLAAAAVVLLHQLRVGLVRGVDATAQSRARDVAALARDHALGTLASLPGADQGVIQVVGPGGQVLASTRGALGRPRLFAFAPSPSVRTVSQVQLRTDVVDLRVVAVAVGPDVVYAGAPVDDVQDGVRVLATQLAVGGPALLLLLVLGAWVITGRALAPVEELRRQAAAVPVDDLGRRVEVPRPPELARLADTLNDLLSRVERSAAQQRGFVDDAAHELRNPVAALLSALELHERRTADPDATALRAEAERLADLVTDLLALARADAHGRPGSTVADLAELVRAELAGRPAVSGELTPVRVVADPGQLRRVVRNLVDNAERHARARVSVSVGREGDEAVLRVADDGPGVPPEDRERVFERFARLDDARTRDAGGVGLGLAITRAVVTGAGGTVAVEDACPGARFVVRLPVASGPSSGGSRRGGRAPGS